MLPPTRNPSTTPSHAPTPTNSRWQDGTPVLDHFDGPRTNAEFSTPEVALNKQVEYLDEVGLLVGQTSLEAHRIDFGGRAVHLGAFER